MQQYSKRISMIVKAKWRVVALTVLLLVGVNSAQAEDIVVGGGSGVLWTGQKFNIDLNSNDSNTAIQHISAPLLAFSDILSSANVCYTVGHPKVLKIDKFIGFKIADGLILVPRGTVSANYKLNNENVETLSGNFGSPGASVTTSRGVTTEAYNNSIACFSPVGEKTVSNYYAMNKPERAVSITGDWMIIGDGTQKTGIYTLPTHYAISRLYWNSNGGRIFHVYKPSFNTSQLKVTNIICQINTPTTIDFGRRYPEGKPFTEMAQVTLPFNVDCTQKPQYYSANIAVYFTALSGHYQGDVHHLALNQPGGYITGEFAGLNQSGACNASSGIAFDNSRIILGAITASDPTKTLTHQLTWRLCEGSTPPDPGPVTASAEVNVVLN